MNAGQSYLDKFDPGYIQRPRPYRDERIRKQIEEHAREVRRKRIQEVRQRMAQLDELSNNPSNNVPMIQLDLLNNERIHKDD